VTPSQARRAAPVEEAAPKKPGIPLKDTWELDENGLPLGARKGIPGEGLPRRTLSKEGWPDLPADDVVNFNSVEPVTLKPGTKLYRVIPNAERAKGPYWSETLPAGRAEWRRDYAVKLNWNKNGQYVEYTVPEGPPFNVWRGETAPQPLKGTDFYLPGGGQQIWMEPGKIIPSEPRPTNW
jgi:hypothetical protein